MKKFTLILLTAIITISAGAQTNAASFDTVPPYKKNKAIPPFKLIQPDSSWLTNADLPKNRPVIFIYFSPECGHCQLAAQEISSNIDKLKDAIFVWVSYYSVPEIKIFTEKYHLAQYENFRFGRDPQYFLPTFFRVKFTPFMALYDSNGQFVQAFEQGAVPEVLAPLIAQSMVKAQAQETPKKKQRHTAR